MSSRKGFPDPVDSVIEVCRKVEPNSVRWLESFDPLPAVTVSSAPVQGAVSSWEQTTRVNVDVYDVNPDAAYILADRLRVALGSGPHATSHGLLDRVVCEVAPYQIVYPDDSITQYRIQFRVISRIQTITRKENLT